MENSFNQDIMARYLTGNCSHDDLSQLLAWIKAAPENVERFESMVGLYEKVAGLQVSDAQKQAALRRLTRRIECENATLRRLNPRRWIGYAALFLVMIGLGATLLFNHRDRKSTRLNSSHANISYAVFCLKKKKKTSRG